MASQVRALLVGVDAYASPNLHRLRGAVNDVRGLAQLLHERFRVPAAHVRILEDQAATRAAIRAALHEHLFAPAREAGSESGPHSVLWLHFSGNGAQRQTADGRRIESIVPFDGRSTGGWDIEDWELGQWITEGLETLGETVSMTVSLDCCHSGSGTRGSGTRWCPPDVRSRPPELQPPSTRRLGNTAGWLVQPDHVLLSACQRDQLAHEHAVLEGNQVRHQGALSYFLMETLALMPQARPWTYQELCWRVREQVERRYENQSPQCEGDRDRLVLDGLQLVRAPALRVIGRDGNQVWIDGGVVHGLAEGALLRVCDSDLGGVSTGTGALERDAAVARGIVRVADAGAVRSHCLVESEAVPVHARVVLVQQADHVPRCRVAVDVSSPELRPQLLQRLAQADVAPFVRVVDRDIGAALRVREHAGCALHVERAGRALCLVPLVPQADGDTLDPLVRALVHLCRFDNIVDLHTRMPRGRLYGSITATAHALLVAPAQPLHTTPLVASSSGEVEVLANQPIVLDIENRYHEPLHLVVLALGSDWSIAPLYPRMRGSRDALLPGERLHLGLSPEQKDQLVVWPPHGYEHSYEIIQVFASSEEIDCELLEQPALADALGNRLSPYHCPPTRGHHAAARSARVPGPVLGRLFERAMWGAMPARTAALDGDPLDDEAWTSARVTLLCRRAGVTPAGTLPASTARAGRP